MVMTLCVSGCAKWAGQSEEGRAAGLLDAAAPYARPHAAALAGDDMAEARRTGARLLVILDQWQKEPRQ